MVKIFVNGNHIDFEAPVYMNETKQEKFIFGLKKIFGERINREDIIENKKVIGDKEVKSKHFIVKDLLLLANPSLNQEQVASKLNKTSFAIQMKRGPLLMELMTWAKKKKLSRLNEKDVKEFLREIGYAE